MKRETPLRRKTGIYIGSMNAEPHFRARSYSLRLGEKTGLMGIVNVTPDSFSDGGNHFAAEKATDAVIALIAAGADIVDIGAESSRPGAREISTDEELARLIPVLDALRAAELPVPISIDTFKAVVAREVLSRGVAIINDIWGLKRDPELARTIAEFDAAVVVMHNNRLEPVSGDLNDGIRASLGESVKLARDAGIAEESIMVDPGIGFGMTPEQNLAILRHTAGFRSLGMPVLIGASRKSFIGHVLDLPVDDRLEGTLATTVAAVAGGADFVRVHDIEANLRVARMADAIYQKGEHR